MKTAAWFSVAVACLAVAACNGDTISSSPSRTSSPSPPSPSRFNPLSGDFTLTGAVRESRSGPISGGNVLFSLDDRPAGYVEVDSQGRYTISHLPAGVLVRVTWNPSWQDLSRGLHQPTPVNTTIVRDTELDIDVVPLSVPREFYCAPPRLSGDVYETTAQGRLPKVGMRVVYTIYDWAGYDAYTQTDGDGRYILCRIPHGRGRIGTGDCNDQVWPIVVDVVGDSVIDFDLTAFNASCRASGGIPRAAR
jgi:hypothetical protein